MHRRLREKKTKLRDIFNAYCEISRNLFDVRDVYEHGDFGGYDGPTSDPIFVMSDDLDTEYLEDELDDNYYLFLEEFHRRDFFDMFLDVENTKLYKYIYLTLKQCDCLQVSQKEDNTIHIKFPAKPSYEELDDIKDTFDEIYDILGVF